MDGTAFFEPAFDHLFLRSKAQHFLHSKQREAHRAHLILILVIAFCEAMIISIWHAVEWLPLKQTWG